ncbi:MAG TPA: DUF1348 family protein [Candidatus Binataceae bacterium]
MRPPHIASRARRLLPDRYGNEYWEFDEAGLMRRRLASINDLPIKEADRKYHWPLGRRPDGHPGLSDLGF